MPYRKDTTDPMTRLLRGYFKTGEELSRVLEVAPKTGRRKISEPQKYLTLGDLTKINRFGHVPIEEIRAAIGGRT